MLTVSVANAVRDAIFRGERGPGDPLREAELSEALSVSRGTVREALQRLCEEGIVEYFPRRGMFVRKLTPQVAEELYTFRALLEPFALRMAMDQGGYSTENLETLQELAFQAEDLARNGDTIYEAIRADVGFHHLVCSRSGHGLLVRTMDSLQSLTWLFVLNTKLYQSDDYSDEPSHYEIFEAIRDGQAEHAAETLRAHIRAAGVALLARMEKMNALD